MTSASHTPPTHPHPLGPLHRESFAGLSRWLNAHLRTPGTAAGDSAVTFSAASMDLALRGHPWGVRRVRLIETMLGRGHCRAAWIWHRDLGLVADLTYLEWTLPPDLWPPRAS